MTAAKTKPGEGRTAADAGREAPLLPLELGRSAPEVLERLVAIGQQAGASDLHLQMTPTGVDVMFRLDGVMKKMTALPADLGSLCLGRIKYLAKLKTYQDSLPQEGRVAAGDVGSRSDIRVSTYPTVLGEKIVLRLFPETVLKSLEELRFPEKARLALERFLLNSAGMLLLTGPAGSGKTTTIYACLQFLAGRGRHIITVEDPVEQVVPSVMQTEVNVDGGLTYAKAAKHLMRQDPEILVIGEIRDHETATVAVQAALTGHMVIATLHGGSCCRVIERLSLMNGDVYSVLSSLELVINQRLVRVLCPDCHGRGCEACLQARYRGRVPVVEWLTIDEAARKALREGGPNAVMPAEELREAGRRLVDAGLTDEAEYARVFGT